MVGEPQVREGGHHVDRGSQLGRRCLPKALRVGARLREVDSCSQDRDATPHLPWDYRDCREGLSEVVRCGAPHFAFGKTRFQAHRSRLLNQTGEGGHHFVGRANEDPVIEVKHRPNQPRVLQETVHDGLDAQRKSQGPEGAALLATRFACQDRSANE